jgi:hypothetical protein
VAQAHTPLSPTPRDHSGIRRQWSNQLCGVRARGQLARVNRPHPRARSKYCAVGLGSVYPSGKSCAILYWPHMQPPCHPNYLIPGGQEACQRPSDQGLQPPGGPRPGAVSPYELARVLLSSPNWGTQGLNSLLHHPICGQMWAADRTPCLVHSLWDSGSGSHTPLYGHRRSSVTGEGDPRSGGGDVSTPHYWSTTHNSYMVTTILLDTLRRSWYNS